MPIQKNINRYLKWQNINFVLHNPSLIKYLIQDTSREEIRINARRLKELKAERQDLKESLKFISSLKNTSPYHIDEKIIIQS